MGATIRVVGETPAVLFLRDQLLGGSIGESCRVTARFRATRHLCLSSFCCTVCWEEESSPVATIHGLEALVHSSAGFGLVLVLVEEDEHRLLTPRCQPLLRVSDGCLAQLLKVKSPAEFEAFVSCYVERG